MDKSADGSRIKRVKSLILLMGGSVVFAFGIAALLVYHYGPSGLYKGRYTLLDPQVIGQLNYNDTNPRTGGTSRFVFDSIQFFYYEPAGKVWNSTTVSLDQYSKIFSLIAGDTSLSQVSEEVMTLFNEGFPSKIVLRVKTESDAKWQEETKIFQEVTFVNKGDYYRIELHEDKKGEHWAYFYHPRIYDQIIKIIQN